MKKLQGLHKSIVKPLRNKIRLYQSIVTLLYLLAMTGIMVVAVVAGDAIFILPQSFRVHIPLLFVVCLLPVVFAGLYYVLRFSELRAARWIETRDESVGNVLTNAVQLVSLQSRSVLQEVLRQQAVDLGCRTARKLKLWPYMRQAVLRAAVSTVAILVFIGLGGLLFDEVINAVLPRFLDPSGDHPPYSRLKFTVSPGDTKILYGENLDIRVETSGRPVEHLYLVAGAKESSHRFAMFLSPDRTYFQILSNLLKDTEYYVTDGRARSRRFKIGIMYTPKITAVQAQFKYPEYTGLSKKRTMLKDEPLKLPAKTQVTLTASSNRPLSSGALTLTPVLGGDAEVIPMERGEQPSTVTGSLTVDQSVIFSLAVKDVIGLESAQRREGRIDVIPDKRPRIYVLEPGKHAAATPESFIPVHVQAEDDYGVNQIFWFRGINQSIERPYTMATPEPDSRTRLLDAQGTFDLKDLGVRPGEVIEYFFEAADNNPDGPNITTSRIYRLEIISEEQYRDILLRQAASKALFETYEVLGNWLRRLAERAEDLEKKAAESSPDPSQEENELEAQFDMLRKEIKEYMQALEQALANPRLFDIESSFHKILGEQLQQLKQLEEEPGFQEGDPRPAINQIARTLKALTQQEQEQIASPVKQIKAVARLMSLADKFVALTGRQEELVRFAGRFSNEQELSRINRMELMELGNGENHLREELMTLFEELPKLLQELPQDETYTPLRKSAVQFLYTAEGIGIVSDLEQAAAGFSELDGPGAYLLAISALEKMRQLISESNAFGQQGEGEQCLRFQPSISNSLGNTLQQILSAMSGHGGQGMDGYSMLAESAALYGPEAELSRTAEAGPGDETSRAAASERVNLMDDRADDPDLEIPDSPGRVKLMKDMKFPMRYRQLIGDYFRKISEFGTEAE